MTQPKLLQKLLEDIAAATDQATTPEQAKKDGKTSYLALENAACYGGYRMIAVNLQNGGHRSPLPNMSSIETRHTGKIMEIYMRGILIGLNYNKAK